MSGKECLVEIVTKQTMRFEELREFVKNLNLENLTPEQQLEIVKLLEGKLCGNASYQSQIAGTQNQVVGEKQYIFNKESFSGMFGDIAQSLKENFGEQVGAEILKELIKSAIAKL